jgi:glycosyltransferase involved in cell wall biosynthesis
MIGNHLAQKAKLDVQIASTGMSFSVFGAFARMARNADIVHYHFPWPVMDIAHLAQRVRKPSVVTYHSDIVRQQRALPLYRPLMHAFLDRVTRIVATSPNYLATSRTLGRYADKIEIIPIGIDGEKTASPLLVAKWRHRLGPAFFLFVGNTRYYKGLDFLIEAAAATGFPVAIAGGGERTADLATTIAHRKLGNVQLLGEVGDDDKLALLEACLGFVFPSHLRSEAFGVALLEAAMIGRPMISCELGTGTSYVNIDGETGIVVPPANAEALAAAMRRLWEDRGLAMEMGGMARQRYERLFTADTMGAAYAGLYDRLLRAGGNGSAVAVAPVRA